MSQRRTYGRCSRRCERNPWPPAKPRPQKRKTTEHRLSERNTTRKRALFGATIAAALGGLLFGFDAAVVSGATDWLTEQFALTDFMLGLTVASALLGAIIGSIVVGRPAAGFPLAGMTAGRGAGAASPFRGWDSWMLDPASAQGGAWRLRPFWRRSRFRCRVRRQGS